MNSLTRAQVIATLGPVDDVIVSEIIGMRATLEELSAGGCGYDLKEWCDT